MLTRLRIQGFKSWRDTGDIRLAPITVFFGANSSGKTSLGQLLLLLKQTSESPDRSQALHPGDRNTPVELGNFREMVFGHEVDGSIGFELEWVLPRSLKVRDPSGGEIARSRVLSFQAKIDLDNGSRARRMSVAEMSYKLDGIRVGMSRKTSEEYEFSTEGFLGERQQKRPPKIGPPVRFNGFPDTIQAAFKNVGFVDDLTLELQSFFQRFFYLGPLREYPSRTYIWSGEAPESVRWRGEEAVTAILAAQDRRISRGRNRKGLPFNRLVAHWLDQLGLSRTFSIQAVGKDRREYDVLVKTPDMATDANLKDVGFGVSQVLPVVVQAFYAPRHSVQLFEQPEIHLHPAVQAELADLFIEAIRARENGEERNNQFLIESHSEHFLRRLQRRIAEGEIDPEHVAIYFCRSGKNGASIEQLEIDDEGDISNWPAHFFGDEMGELAAKLPRIPVTRAACTQ